VSFGVVSMPELASKKEPWFYPGRNGVMHFGHYEWLLVPAAQSYPAHRQSSEVVDLMRVSLRRKAVQMGTSRAYWHFGLNFGLL
jgi:hypothetical protein